jgi:hypothetical protein
MLVFVVLLRYALFHLLSASFVVGMVLLVPFPYYTGGIFLRKTQRSRIIWDNHVFDS